ncbi:MAG: hypothetical protein QOI95_3939 [Acidimicrobiaceae bacterium]
MNDRQRVLLVVALGLTIAVIVRTWDGIISADDGGGWFAYAPETAAVFASKSSDIFRSGVMWMGGVIVWAACSFRLLSGTRPRQPETDSDPT